MLRRSALAVLPSHSENYSMGVVGALACDTPVLATTGTPWSDFPKERCGWWVAPDPRAIAATIVEALGLSGRQLDEMGERGRAFVEREHAMASVTRRMVDCYCWALAVSLRRACLNGGR